MTSGTARRSGSASVKVDLTAVIAMSADHRRSLSTLAGAFARALRPASQPVARAASG